MTHVQNLPSKPRQDFTLTLTATMMGSMGMTLLMFAGAYMRDLETLASTPNVIWDAICGRPTPDGIVLPVLFATGVLLTLGAVGTFGYQKLGIRQGTRGRTLLLVLGGVLVVALGALIFAVVNVAATARWGQTESVLVNAEGGATSIMPPREVFDFTLTSHTGEPVSLSDLRGKPVLMSFGYTHCPDVCPLTLTVYNRVNELLGEDADKAHFVFVSVDGERDTPAQLASYLQLRGVDDFALAMTGSEGDLRSLGADYGLYFEHQAPLNGDSDNYAVDHTASTFLIDAEGKLSTIFGFGAQPEVIYGYLAEAL